MTSDPKGVVDTLRHKVGPKPHERGESEPREEGELITVVGKVLSEEDAELFDQDLSDRHEDMSPSATPLAPVKLGEVANGIASCCALSFFSISMILANKVRSCRALPGGT